MNEKERKVLYSLCNGDISFTEAAELLGMSKEKIKKMLENYTWTPSSEKMSELHETEMETLLYIKEITMVKNGISQTQIKKLKQILKTKDMSTDISIFGSMIELVPFMTKKSRRMKIYVYGYGR